MKRGGHRSDRLTGVGHDHLGGRHRQLALGQGGHRSGAHRGAGEVVPVDVLASDAAEQSSGLDDSRPAICTSHASSATAAEASPVLRHGLPVSRRIR